MSGHSGRVFAIAVTPDGQQIVSASDDKTLRVWELNKGTSVPLKWARIRLTVSSLAIALLVGLVIIHLWTAIPVIMAISFLIFDLTEEFWFYGLFISLFFAITFSIPIGLFLEIMGASSNGLNILGIPLFGSVYNNTFLFTFCIVFGLILSVAAASVRFSVLRLIITITVVGIFLVVASGIWSGIRLQSSQANAQTTIVDRINAAAKTSSEIVSIVAFFSFTMLAGYSRVIFYPIELLLVLYSQFKSQKHLVEWDELVILPLPGTRWLLSQRLQQDQVAGLILVSDVAWKPFQRPAANKALKSYLHTQAGPLHLLYKLLTHPDLDTYAVVPVSEEDWKNLPTIRHLLLRELSEQWINSTRWIDRASERLVRKIAHWRHNSDQTPLTLFAGMLYQLLDNKKVNAEDFNLFSYSPIYIRLTDYPGGIEIERSFEAMASFLSYKELSALPTAINFISKLPPQETAIRPSVMNALSQLGDIGAEIATYQIATSRVNQLAAIARATDNLDVLDEYVNTDLVAPEQTIIQRIIRQWRKLVSEAGGQVGREEDLAPVENPYVAGNPVIGSLFVGRKDILRELEELWIQPEQCSSVVLYGHRRMGKSSILKNLSNRFGSQTIIVDFNMQRVGLVDNTSELMYSLALAIYDSLPATGQVELGEPDEERFTNHNPYTVFGRFLKQVSDLQMQKRLIVTIDEFELIEKLINEKRLQPELLGFWREMIQTYPWFVMAFAGLYTLQDMTENYWHPLFGSVKALKVSFLSPTAARKLITQPHPDFNLDYDEAAIEQIIDLTNGQPYLIQLICQNLITRYNRQMFEENISRDRRFTREDVEAIVSTSEFFRDGDAYFKGVWNQADSSPVGQTDILKVLCGQDVSSFSIKMSLAEIVSQTNLSLGEVKAALITLENHDVIIQNNQQYTYTVELMRRWVAKTQKDQL